MVDQTKNNFLDEVAENLSRISRALDQGHAPGWVRAAATIRSVSTINGHANLAGRCRELESIADPELTHMAEIAFEKIAQEFARVSIHG